jgi:hypothetical protein
LGFRTIAEPFKTYHQILIVEFSLESYDVGTPEGGGVLLWHFTYNVHAHIVLSKGLNYMIIKPQGPLKRNLGRLK